MDRYKIHKKANDVVKQCGTRDAFRAARDLGINIMYKDFSKLLGMYTYAYRNRFIVLSNNIPVRLEQEVVAHEIGHDQLHRHLAEKGLKEFSMYNIKDTAEYEANVFTAHFLLDDNELYRAIKEGFNVPRLALMFEVDFNLMLIKIEEMRHVGYKLNEAMQSFNCKFLGVPAIDQI